MRVKKTVSQRVSTLCVVLNLIRAKGYDCTMKCRFTSLSTPTSKAIMIVGLSCSLNS